MLLTLGSGPSSRTERQTISMNIDGESEDETSVIKKEFKDPTKLNVLPPKEAVQTRPFRDPMRVHPLPPRDKGGQGGNDCTMFPHLLLSRG